ncbi:CoA ester lyase [bacterium]|nr:CoA ester lyase [bacterium]
MKKPYKGPWVFRSFLFVPGHKASFLRKASRTNADAIALCLEDAVPVREKGNARIMVKQFLTEGCFESKPIFVRINPMETGLTLRDLEGVACEDLDGFVYPMAKTPDDIKSFDAQLSLIETQMGLDKNHFSIVVLIETPLAVLNAYDIAKASERVIALLFGCEDYMAEMESRHSHHESSLFVARNLLVMAARAANIVPIDTPYVSIRDLAGLKRFAMEGRDLGMAGMLVMSPSQIEVVHSCYTPKREEIDYATDVVKAAESAEKEGHGIIVVRDKFISPPTLKQSIRLLENCMNIKKYEEF